MKWSDILPEPAMAIGDRLRAQANQLRAQGVNVCPSDGQVFRALQLTPPDRLKAVIVGQDPYHTPGAANGLAFSVNPGHPFQPSLANIFQELQGDVGCPIPRSGDLTPWAERGVLLLNTHLTVQAGIAGSHSSWGWEKFTGAVLKTAHELPQPVVFILWGAHARRAVQAAGIKWDASSNKQMVSSVHPSPLSASKGFFGSRPFSSANRLLQLCGAQPIDWSL